jgi:hypothetical protein
MASWQTQTKNIAMAIAVLSAIVMALTIGIGEAAQVVINPNSLENPLDANTTAVFGPSGPDFVDRVAVLGVFVTILGGAGLAVLTPGSSNPPFINSLLRNMPIVVGLIAFTAFSTEVFDIIQGNRDWSLYSDAVNSYMLFLASSFVAGLLSLLGNRR